MEIYQASTLDGAQIKRPQMVVENLLPAGMTVVAGAPKIGKSWLTLMLACAVAEGTPFLGRQVFEGDVLLLDLEGSPARLQDRLEMLGRGYPERLSVAHSAPTIDKGLLDELNYWAVCAPLPRLVIVDTIVRARGNTTGRKNAYEADSEIYGRIQKFAIDQKLSVVCVTHLRKLDPRIGTDADWLERLSGSMGLPGVSDTIWGLFRQRGSDEAVLRTASRDIESGDMILKFTDGIWAFVSDDLDGYSFQRDPLVQYLASIDSYNGSSSELCDRYIAFCRENKLHNGLSGGSPVSSFGKKLKRISSEMWRIKKSVVITRTRDSTQIMISKF